MATRSLGTLTLDLVAKVGSFEQGLNKADRSSKRTFKNVERNANKAAKAMVAVGAAIAGVGAAVIASTIKQENAIKQLEARLDSTRGVAGKTSDELQTLASSLQTVTTFGDESIIEMEALLLTFTNIRGEIFDRTVPAILDVSVAMGTDLKSSAIQLGKALNDPVLGLSALSRSGIQFTDDQKKVIKALVDTGRTAEAQALILDELGTQFGGAATAAADTLGGSLKQLKNAFGDLLEAPGGIEDSKESIQELTAILQDPATIAAAQELTTALIEGFTSVIELMRETIGLTQFLGEEFAAAIGGPALDDTVRINEELGKLALRREALTSRTDLTASFLEEELSVLDAEISRYNELLDLNEELGEGRRALPSIIPPDPMPAPEAGTAPSSPAGIVVPDKIDQSVAALQQQVELLGLSAKEQELFKLSTQGATEAQLALARSAIETVEVFDLELQAQKALTDEIDNTNQAASAIFESLRTEEEAIEESYQRRREIILENTKFTGEAQTELMRRLQEDRDTQISELQAANAENRNESVAESYSVLLGIIGSYYDGLEGEEAGYARVALSLGEALLDQDKREALQSIVANTQSAAMKAFDSLAGIPYVGPALGAAAALGIVAAGGSAAAKVAGLAHDGIDSVPQDGTWLLEAGERVTTSETSAKLDNTLDQIQENQGAGGMGGIRIVNAWNDDVIDNWGASPRGERVIMNVVEKNQQTIRSLADGGV